MKRILEKFILGGILGMFLFGLWLGVCVNTAKGATKTQEILAGQSWTVYTESSCEIGDTINYTFTLSNAQEGDHLDFWLEDNSGAQYAKLTDTKGYTGSYTVNSAGVWKLIWKNNNIMDPITIIYDASIIKKPATSDEGGSCGVITFMVLFLPVSMIWLMVYRKKQ